MTLPDEYKGLYVMNIGSTISAFSFLGPSFRRTDLDPFKQLVNKSLSSFGANKILLYQGPNSRFVLEAIFKPLIAKSSRSSIMITINCVHTNHDF